MCLNVFIYLKYFRICEYPPHEIEICYADIMKTMYVTIFYSTVVPVGMTNYSFEKKILPIYNVLIFFFRVNYKSCRISYLLLGRKIYYK